LYICGGERKPENTAYNRKACWGLDVEAASPVWVATAPMPNERAQFQLVSHKESVYAFNGFWVTWDGKGSHGAEGHQSVDRFLAQENRWEVHNNWNTPTYSLATTCVAVDHQKEKAFIIGGYDSEKGSRQNRVFIYRLVTQTFQQEWAHFPSGFEAAGCGIFKSVNNGERMLVVSGGFWDSFAYGHTFYMNIDKSNSVIGISSAEPGFLATAHLLRLNAYEAYLVGACEDVVFLSCEKSKNWFRWFDSTSTGLGLTRRGEPCLEACTFTATPLPPFLSEQAYWCFKQPSQLEEQEWDFCSIDSSKTYKNEVCDDKCSKRGLDYYHCNVKESTDPQYESRKGICSPSPSKNPTYGIEKVAGVNRTLHNLRGMAATTIPRSSSIITGCSPVEDDLS